MRKLAGYFSLTFALILPSMQSTSAVDITGAQCKKVNIEKVLGDKTYRCSKKGKKKVWQVISEPKKQIESSNDNFYSTYSSGPGPSGQSAKAKSPEMIFNPQVSSSSNVLIWVYDPEIPNKALGSNGIFSKKSGEDWKWVSGNSDGTVITSWSPGEYLVDTVEPNGNINKYQRRTYQLIVDSNLKVSVVGLDPNSNGFFGMTINLRKSEESLTNFSPVSACQLLGQDGNMELNVGFPHRESRLKTSGEIKALIVPVDFPDVIATSNPVEDFYEMAKGNRDFYKRQSNGKVNFVYQVYPTYIRMPFESNKYGLGTWSAGDSMGYWKATLNAADPFVDFSLFDVIYVLSPKRIPRSSIAYGPAFPVRVETADGPVFNGTFSGADAYQALSGAEWKWLAHETGHLFGFHDLYVARPNPETFGSWDIMSLNWSLGAIELSAWNRYLKGWLETNEVSCLTSDTLTSTTISLSPLVENGAGNRAQFIRLSSSKILVLEYRKTAGLDRVLPSNTGILVYTVDMTIPTMKGGWKVQRRNSTSISDDLTDAALKVGDSISVEGIRLSVVSITPNESRIELSKN